MGGSLVDATELLAEVLGAADVGPADSGLAEVELPLVPQPASSAKLQIAVINSSARGTIFLSPSPWRYPNEN